MKILFIGYSPISKTLISAFKDMHELVLVELDELSELTQHNDSDGCIISINDDSFDSSQLIDVIDKLPIYMPIMIKNLLPIPIIDKIKEMYPDHSIVISPDFHNQQYIVIGGEDPDCFWQDLFQSSLPNCKMILNCSDSEAALVKYAEIGFFATKNAYFNQLYDICNKCGLDFNIVRQVLTTNSKINSDYSMVPNADGTRGLNETVFTSHINEFISWSEEIQATSLILKSITKYNDEIKNNQ